MLQYMAWRSGLISNFQFNDVPEFHAYYDGNFILSCTFYDTCQTRGPFFKWDLQVCLFFNICECTLNHLRWKQSVLHLYLLSLYWLANSSIAVFGHIEGCNQVLFMLFINLLIYWLWQIVEYVHRSFAAESNVTFWKAPDRQTWGFPYGPSVPHRQETNHHQPVKVRRHKHGRGKGLTAVGLDRYP